jgi:hypothetical protein
MQDTSAPFAHQMGIATQWMAKLSVSAIQVLLGMVMFAKVLRASTSRTLSMAVCL